MEKKSRPLIVTWVPIGPSVGNIPMIDSIVHSVEINSVELDKSGTYSVHMVALRIFDEHDELTTKPKIKYGAFLDDWTKIRYI